MHELAVVSCALVIAASSAGCHMGLLGLLAGTSDSEGMYRAGALTEELGDASVRTLGCLDVGLKIVDRPEPRDEGTSLVELHVANRCAHPEALDFARVRIEGSAPDGASRVVLLDDPRSEIVKLHVGAGENGRERIRLLTSAGLVQLAFDLDAVAPDAPSAHPARVNFTRVSPTASWTAVTL